MTLSAVVYYVEPTSTFDVVVSYNVGRGICFDINDPANFLILQCPLVGIPPGSSDTITRTWSKITDDGENIVLFSVLDSVQPQVDNNADAVNFYTHFPRSTDFISFGFEIAFPPITYHDLIFYTASLPGRDIEGLSEVFGTWNCTVSNSIESDSALTTISLSDCCECICTTEPYKHMCTMYADIHWVLSMVLLV